MIGGSETTILIPSSTTMESRDERIRTLKVGTIARAAAVFRVDRIVIYRDPEFDDSRFISRVLQYAETPQYLRKRLFPRERALRYVGVLPPLRTPHHPTSSKVSTLKVGEFRVGLVVDEVGSDNGAWVDIGVERPLPLKTASRYRAGQRLNVRVFSLKPLAAEPVDRSEIPHYWGYETEVIPNLDEHVSSTESLVVATSRVGAPATPDILRQTVRQGRRRGLEVVFGSPARGVDAFLSSETMEGCCVINTIPHQGTETVRLEEAIVATLAQVNLMRSLEG
ncbi:putative RNA uridine N3 methyltransferase [Methanocrinis sp.]|uniref:putative RNA uridine N3 methyltransferase n=1 Tax=Methanocrinis sp. TaxID=3101522 RepID=UPI003D0B3E45